MQLSVPQRGVADHGSFPIEPADVGRWLEGLSPLASEGDAREVYRGLRHSNRLHNDPARRRAVLGRFVPVLHELHEQLAEPARAQPLPLAREFARGAALVEALLGEEACAFKVLLADSEPPEPDDARRAMRALARRAEIIAHGYRRLPDTLLEEAHALYALAESCDLLESGAGAETPADGLTLVDHYRYILLLAAVDTRQLRARQLPLALDFLREAAATIVLQRDVTGGADGLGVDLARGAHPEPVASLLGSRPETLRTFDPGRLLERIDRQIARTRVARINTLGVDVLERQTLGRLRSSLAGERVRRLARTIAELPQPAVFGHKEIATHLLFDLTRSHATADSTEHATGHAAHDAPDDTAGWTLANRSSQGARLSNPACRPGTVQVGELVALSGLDARARADGVRATTLLGCVRWVQADGDSGVTLGLEYLARGVMPVAVTRSDGDATVAENALIIACKVRRSTVQTILLPPYLYEVGEQLTATQGGRSRRLWLRSCLQTNGLFEHFRLD